MKKIKQSCEVCYKTVEVNDIYSVQRCSFCGSRILADSDNIIITDIVEVSRVDQRSFGEYNFTIEFNYVGKESTSKFESEYDVITPYISVTIKDRLDRFHLKPIKPIVMFNGDSYEVDDYNFSNVQLDEIKCLIRLNITDDDIENSKKIHMLMSICNWYGYNIVKSLEGYSFDNGSTDYRFSAVSVDDALIQWYDTMKDTDDDLWAEDEAEIWIEERELILELLSKRAVNIIKEWLGDYSYKYVGIDGEIITTKDLQSTEDVIEEENSVSHWCNYFIEEIESKIQQGVDSDIEKQWKDELYILKTYTMAKCKKTPCDSSLDASQNSVLIDTVKKWIGNCSYTIIEEEDGVFTVEDEADGSLYVNDLNYWCEHLIGEIENKLDEDTSDMESEWIEEMKNELSILKNHVSNNQRAERLLKDVCENYGCDLDIKEDGSVVLEEYVEAICDSIEDALVLFYRHTLKEDWTVESDLEFIKSLIKDDEEDDETPINTLKVSMDATLVYHGLPYNGVHRINFSTGVPFITKDGKILLATYVMGRQYNYGDAVRFAIENIYSNGTYVNIKDLQYWLGIHTDEMFETMDKLIQQHI